MAQKGLNVLLLERGHVPGEKNMFGGMLPNCPVVEELMPDFWDQAPWERHVIRRALTMISDASATSMVFESQNFDSPPYSGFTLFRPHFDKWYAEKASEAGARLLCGCRVDELIMEGGSVLGVRTGKDEVRAPVVVLCDGVLSLLARKAGMIDLYQPSEMALGVKALFSMDEESLNERFNLVKRQGLTQEFLGCTEGIRGGGFIYTQTETLSVGLVFHLDSLRASGLAPYNLFQKFLTYDVIQRILKGTRLVEYSAHLLPEGGYKGIQKLYGNGVLLAGDAAGLCYTNGLNQEGMNLAITSGFLAAETIHDALRTGDCSQKSLAQYEGRLKESFVLRDMKTFEKVVDLMHNDRLFSVYPKLIGTIMEQLYRADGKPRKSFGRLGWDAVKEIIPTKHLISDLIKGGKALT
jgi:electron transfer flavoprotein-quinone oxidoreductase